MAEVQTGFFWHVHHDRLLEWCYSYNERASYISEQKREDQKETRLRLFKPVRGTLPQEVVEAGQAYVEAGQISNKAWRVYYKTGQFRDKEWRAYVKAEQAHSRAWRALDEALRKNMPAIEALHRKECHNCPWDGKTIFPKA